MKRYISAILIPCILMQLYGCYSFQNISVEGLSNQEKRDDITFLDDNGYKYLFKAEDYKIKNDSIEGIGLKSKIDNDMEKELFKGKFATSDMKSIQTDRFNFVNTCLLVLSIVGLVFLVGYISFENQEWHLNLGHL